MSKVPLGYLRTSRPVDLYPQVSVHVGRRPSCCSFRLAVLPVSLLVLLFSPSRLPSGVTRSAARLDL